MASVYLLLRKLCNSRKLHRDLSGKKLPHQIFELAVKAGLFKSRQAAPFKLDLKAAEFKLMTRLVKEAVYH